MPLLKPKTNTHSHRHTYTQLQTYQMSKKGKEDQSKHTPGRGNKTLIKTNSIRQESFILETGVNSSLISTPFKRPCATHVL